MSGTLAAAVVRGRARAEVRSGPGSRSAVNGGLTVTRPRRVVENSDYAGFVGRVLRAHGRRVAAGDVEALVDLLALAEETDRAVGEAVAGLRRSGYSWAEIASRIGVTRQAAQQRWGSAPVDGFREVVR